MKLHAKEVVFFYCGGKWLAVVGLGDGIWAYWHCISMHEVEIGSVRDTTEQMVTGLCGNLIPPHMRQRQTKISHLFYWCINHPEGGDPATFLTAGCQQLHTKADPQHGLSTTFDQFDKLALPQLFHGGMGGAHTRHKQFVCSQDDCRVAADNRCITQTLYRIGDRGEIGTTGIQDHHIHYSTPFELGRVLPSTRMA
ncbi:conserved hypothetical protein [Yersinia pestis Nepal516]|nr:conserved hypothetical protein [Yersinia pestis Nepal516]